MKTVRSLICWWDAQTEDGANGSMMLQQPCRNTGSYSTNHWNQTFCIVLIPEKSRIMIMGLNVINTCSLWMWTLGVTSLKCVLTHSLVKLENYLNIVRGDALMHCTWNQFYTAFSLSFLKKKFFIFTGEPHSDKNIYFQGSPAEVEDL